MTPRVLAVGLAGAIGLVLVDAIVHVTLSAGWPTRYVPAYAAFVRSFEGQTRPAILAGGLLAGSEELLFRGVLLTALLHETAIPAWFAVVLTGVGFGFAHYRPAPAGRWFTAWAIWEGTLLGGLYVLSGSLVVVVVVAHVLHDLGGFQLLAWQRVHGIIEGPSPESIDR